MAEQVFGELLRQRSHLSLLERIAGALWNDALIQLIECLAQANHEIVEIGIKEPLKQALSFVGRKPLLPVSPEIHQLGRRRTKVHRQPATHADSGEQLHCRQQRSLLQLRRKVQRSQRSKVR